MNNERDGGSNVIFQDYPQARQRLIKVPSYVSIGQGPNLVELLVDDQSWYFKIVDGPFQVLTPNQIKLKLFQA